MRECPQNLTLYLTKVILFGRNLKEINVRYPLESVLIIIGSFPIASHEKYSYVLVTVDYFSECTKSVPLGKASEMEATNDFFDNFFLNIEYL